MALGLAFAGMALLLALPREPIYLGRPISAWLDDMAAHKATASSAAIKNIGTNAIPYAVRNLARNDSWWRAKYKAIRPKLPKLLQKRVPELKTNLQAVEGANVFYHVGTNSLPFAIALLKHESSTVRQAAAWGLSSLRRMSPAATAAIPALTQALDDPDRMVRFNACISLREMGADASNAVPALTRLVANSGTGPQTNDFYVRAVAAVALGKIGPAAGSAVPALKGCLQESNTYLHGQAAVAIWRISADVDTALPVILREMPATIQDSKWDWIIALGEMGPRAPAAFPVLTNELKSSSYKWVLEYVTNSLVSIDAEAAAKIGVHKPPPAPAK